MRLSKKKAEWVGQWKPQLLKGSTLHPSAKETDRFKGMLASLTDKMVQDVQRDVMHLFASPAAAALDADDVDDGYGAPSPEPKTAAIIATTGSIASQSRILMRSLKDKYQQQFGLAAKKLSLSMVGAMLKSSEQGLQASLKKATGSRIGAEVFRSAQRNEIVKAAVTETANLIKRIPADYLGNVELALLRSITTQAGTPALSDTLENEMQRHGIKVKNWVHNTTRDQTAKVYTGISRANMMAAGVTHFEWIHSGGSNEPRPLHVALSGRICSFDDPPVIQNATKTQPEIRGFPGQLIHCGCKMRPVIDPSP